MNPLPHADLIQLKRWNTPTICNGWKQITQRDAGTEGFDAIDEAACNFGTAARQFFGRKGEW